LPQLMDGVARTANISVANGQSRTIGPGSYGARILGKDASVRLSGGTVTFASIDADKAASIIFEATSDVVVKGTMTLDAGATIGGPPGVTTKHRIFFVHGASVSIAKDSTIAATIYAPNGSIILDQDARVTGAIAGRDIRIGKLS